jgi:hypothetical protein
MHVPAAYIRQAQFDKAVAQATQGFAPDVVEIVPTLGDDWSGEPAASPSKLNQPVPN